MEARFQNSLEKVIRMLFRRSKKPLKSLLQINKIKTKPKLLRVPVFRIPRTW
jgi:hypothetical protein